MSRSYRHTDMVKQQNSKGMKRFANKRVRHDLDIPSGKAYKKKFCSYDICDYKWIWTKADAIREWELAVAGLDYTWLLKNFHSLQEYLAYWEKCVRRK